MIMKKRYKIAWWIISIGWFPMMFAHTASTRWNHNAASILLLMTLVICIIGVFILLSTNIDHIFKSSETLTKEIAANRAARLSSDRWTEAVKREAAASIGITAKTVTKTYEGLVKRNWKP